MRKIKIIASGLMIVLLLSITAFCTVFFSRMNKEGKVVVTIFPLYDICREILGTDNDIVLLQDSGSDMHSYQATASDIATISKAELFLVVGGESDNWVGGAIRSAGNVNLKTLSLMDIVNKIEESDENISGDGHEHEHDHDHNNGEKIEYDEHVWLSIKNMIISTMEIKEELISVFPERTEIINENADKYISKLRELDTQYGEALKDKNAFYLVADRFPFIYLMQDYGLNYYAAFSGCSTDANATASMKAELEDIAKEKGLKYIYTTENPVSDIASSLQSKLGNVKVLALNSCQAVSRNNLKNISYYQVMLDNLEKLKLGVRL